MSFHLYVILRQSPERYINNILLRISSQNNFSILYIIAGIRKDLSIHQRKSICIYYLIKLLKVYVLRNTICG